MCDEVLPAVRVCCDCVETGVVCSPALHVLCVVVLRVAVSHVVCYVGFVKTDICFFIPNLIITLYETSIMH